MDIPVKKNSNGFKIPVYGLGTWEIGGGNERDIFYDDSQSIRLIQQAIELGISHIDTAEAYAQGYAEEIIGKAIKGTERKKLFITSKVLPKNLGYKDLINSCRQSLKRLGTDYLDLYLIHRPNPEISLEETIKAMDYLVKKGMVKFIGVSNFTNENLEKAQQMTTNKIVVNQVHYNLIHREAEKFGVVDYCQAKDVVMVAYTPIQKGLLSGMEFDLLNKMAKKYQKTSSQIAINWLVSQDNIVTIAKTLNSDHLKENIGALGWMLENKDINLLRDKFPGQLMTSKSYLQDIRNNYL